MFGKETYTERRATLVRKMQELGLGLGQVHTRESRQAGDKSARGLILLPGNGESPVNYAANTYRFRQDSTFLYYFGLDVPGLAGVIDLDSGGAWLFGDDFSIDDIIWMGPQPRIAELAERVGVASDHTSPLASLAGVIAKAASQGREVHILPPYRGETQIMLSQLFAGAGADSASGTAAAKGSIPAPSEQLIRAVVSMRDKKSPEEIAEIEKACRTGYLMHTLAMRMCRPGASEREIAGAIEGIALQHGWGVSFHSIVSQHGETLHNHSHEGTLENGRMLLVDAGAEATSGYASDFTRTIPVSGRFTSRQKDIYDIVLAANNHAFAISAPGIRYVDVHLASSRVLIEGLRALGLVRGSVDDAVAAGVHSLFMPHGLGHQMGLDVHDMENLGERFVGYDAETPRSTHPSCSACRMGRRLVPGMVVTVEPGIYFVPALIAKWRAEGTGAQFIDFGRVEGYLDFGGIRLEDDMLITADGNRLLASPASSLPGTPAGNDNSDSIPGSPLRIPITTEEVERAMQR